MEFGLLLADEFTLWVTYLSKILFGSVFPTLLSQSINGKSHNVIDKSHNFEKAQNHIDYSHFLIRSFIILKRIELLKSNVQFKSNLTKRFKSVDLFKKPHMMMFD